MSPQSSRPPAGVPDSSNNARYAIVAVVLLLAIGGIYFWRTRSSDDHPPAPLPTTSAASVDQAPTNPKIDDVPLPPPIEDKPEAGPGPRVAGGGGAIVGGCEGKCAGSAPNELQQALQVRGAQSRRCYNQALNSDSTLRGHVTVTVRIGPGGNVCSAAVTANDMGSTAVAQCAANIFRNASGYPAPRGGCVDVAVPLSFVPQGQ
jgi:hypothetical protein